MIKFILFGKANSEFKQIARILLITFLVFGTFNVSAQMKYFLNQTATHTSTTTTPGDFDLDFDGDGSKEFEVNLLDGYALRIKGRKKPSWGEVLGQANTVTVTNPTSGEANILDVPTATATPPASSSTDQTWHDRNTNTVLYCDTGDNNVGNNGVLGTTGQIYIGVRWVVNGENDPADNTNTYYGWIQMTITDKDNWSIDAWAYNTDVGEHAWGTLEYPNHVSTTATPGDFDLDFDGDGSKEYEVNDLDDILLRIKGKKSPSWGEVLGDANFVTVGDNSFDIPTVFNEPTTKGPDDTTWNDRDTNTVLYYDTGDTTIGNNGILGQTGEVYLALCFIKGGENDDAANLAYYGWMHMTITDDLNWSINSYAWNPTAMNSPGYPALSNGINEFDTNVLVFKENNNLIIKNLPEISDYKLYSILGQEVKRGVFEENDSTIDISSLKTGLYLLKAEGKISGKLFTRKIIF
jgi:hypothetical protein